MHPVPKSLNFRHIKPQWVPQDRGALVLRIIGGNPSHLDPFLLLDYANIKASAGFPPHPHRGFQTVSYIRRGCVEHEDFKGHKGIIRAGDLQWMTAGKGIVHSQKPVAGDGETGAIGYQLWINLLAKDKMIDPNYQEFSAKNIQKSEVMDDKGNLFYSVKVISGLWKTMKGHIQVSSPVRFLDFLVSQMDKPIQIDLTEGWNGLIFVQQGSLKWQSGAINKHQALLFSSLKPQGQKQSNHQEFLALIATTQSTSFIFLQGKPLNQPIVRRGPFVLSTQEQLQQAFKDFQYDQNGFEGARKWINEKNSTY